MSKHVPPLKPEAVERIAQTIGDHFTGTEITRLFARSGHGRIVHDGTTKWRFVFEELQLLQRRDVSANGVLRVVREAGSPQGWLGRREQYDAFLLSINEAPGFYGLRLCDDGGLVSTGEAATTVARTKSIDEVEFAARGFHPAIRKHGRRHFCHGAYFYAVFECCKAFDAVIRDSTNSSKSGQPLMSEALSLRGQVKLNAQQNQS
jgi:hypothetical protein